MTAHPPRILVTPWRQELRTALAAREDLYTLAPAYADAVLRAGGLPLVATHVPESALPELLANVDGVLVTGGQDMDPACYGQVNTDSHRLRPEVDAADLALVRAALDAGVPVLGVCRGVQVVNVVFGGDLRQEVHQVGSAVHPTYEEMGDGLTAHRHDVEVVAGSRLARVMGAGRTSVNSLHHQAVGRVGAGLRVVATAPDGVIEALEGATTDVLAVQWHPETLADAGSDALFADLVERSRVRARMGP